MSAFRFKYESVLRQRQAVEDDRQRELAKHLRHHNIIRSQLDCMEQTCRDTRRQLTGDLVGRLDLDRVRDVARYSGHLTARAQQVARQLAELERRIGKARAALAEAMRRRKAIQKLRDKHHRRWLVEQQRRETAELDELAAQRYARGVRVESMS